MKKTAVFALLAAALTAAQGINALGIGESNSDRQRQGEPRKVEVSGRVRLIGNSPMTSLVISGDDREWYIEPGEQQKLMHLQQQTVTVRAVEYYHDMVFGNGSSAGRYYYLKNITLVSPKS